MVCDNNKHNENEEGGIKSFIFFNVLTDGTIKLKKPESVNNQIPPADDPVTGVKIKDVEISSAVSARVFLPPGACTNTKLPLLLYIHGGGFCMESAFSATYTRYATRLVAQANVVCVSVEYGLFPTQCISSCYEDSWAALEWVASHGSGHGPEPWINDYANLEKVFVGGDSAGGNMSHFLLARVGSTGLSEGFKIEGMILAHPFFSIGGKDDAMWLYMCRSNEGPSDRRMMPAVEDLAKIGCRRVLVLVGEKDRLKVAGTRYVEDLKRSGWDGEVDLFEDEDKNHCFHLNDLEDKKAIFNMQRIVSFINQH